MSQIAKEHTGLRLFSELLEIPAPSGHEDRMAEYLDARLRGLGYTPEVDPAGNVVVRLDGRSPDRPVCCMAAHMDEIGLVVTGVAPNGVLRVDRLGGTLPWKLGETAVEILGDRESILGVTSMGSGHSRAQSSECPGWEDVRVLTGLPAEQLAEKGVRIGSPIVPANEVRGPFLFGDPMEPWIAAWTFDNRLSVACLLQALEGLTGGGHTPRSPTIIAFTVEEEIGCLGAKVLAQRERPDVFIAIDGSPLVPECPVELDGHPGIRSRDRVATYDQDLLREICRISSDAGVDLQPVVYSGAASDASLVYSIGASPRVACLGYVRASSHGFEATPLVTLDHTLTVIQALLMHL
jgi:putative aminopeptidase FrvX